MTEQKVEKRKRMLSGKVVSDKCDKTLTVLVERRVKHPVYGKIVRRSTKFHAHDESNSAKTGDIVTIEECRPISRQKSWRLVRIEEAARI